MCGPAPQSKFSMVDPSTANAPASPLGEHTVCRLRAANGEGERLEPEPRQRHRPPVPQLTITSEEGTTHDSLELEMEPDCSSIRLCRKLSNSSLSSTGSSLFEESEDDLLDGHLQDQGGESQEDECLVSGRSLQLIGTSAEEISPQWSGTSEFRGVKVVLPGLDK